MFLALQALAPPIGSVDVTALPDSSPATQSEVDVHEMPSTVLPKTLLTVHALAPPGEFVVVTALPGLSTATQNEIDAHDTPVKTPYVLSTAAEVQADAPPVG
jgi:hypothetical protein